MSWSVLRNVLGKLCFSLFCCLWSKTLLPASSVECIDVVFLVELTVDRDIAASMRPESACKIRMYNITVRAVPVTIYIAWNGSMTEITPSIGFTKTWGQLIYIGFMGQQCGSCGLSCSRCRKVSVMMINQGGRSWNKTTTPLIALS